VQTALEIQHRQAIRQRQVQERCFSTLSLVKQILRQFDKSQGAFVSWNLFSKFLRKLQGEEIAKKRSL
jgi:hypothetical protein